MVVLFAGDDGALHLTADGPTTLRGNFLIRTASYRVQKGDAAVLIDTPSDYPNGIDDGFPTWISRDRGRSSGGY